MYLPPPYQKWPRAHYYITDCGENCKTYPDNHKNIQKNANGTRKPPKTIVRISDLYTAVNILIATPPPPDHPAAEFCNFILLYSDGGAGGTHCFYAIYIKVTAQGPTLALDNPPNTHNQLKIHRPPLLDFFDDVVTGGHRSRLDGMRFVFA